MVIPGHVSRADIPVLFTTAEWDNARYLWPQAAVYNELVNKHGAAPLPAEPGTQPFVATVVGRHIDTSVSRELVDFIERTVKR